MRSVDGDSEPEPVSEPVDGGSLDAAADAACPESGDESCDESLEHPDTVRTMAVAVTSNPSSR
jgi:hypothetical protein